MSFSSSSSSGLRLLRRPAPAPAPAPAALRSIIKRLFRERDPDKLAAGFIAAAAASPRFRCRHRIYSSAVRRLAAAGRPDAVAAVLDSHLRFPSDLSHEGFSARLISLYGAASMPSHAAALFRRLPSLSAPRSALSFNALLTALADSSSSSSSSSSNPDALLAAFDQIPAEDPSIVPNLCSYNILIRALCAKPDLDAAFDVLSLMEQRGISPDLISFNTLLNGFFGHSRFPDGDKVWNLMRERNVEPDVKSFNAKLRGLVLEKRTEEAAELVDRMMRDGPKPDTSSFNAVIRGHCNIGNLEAAKTVFLDLVKNGCAPNKGPSRR
uniref:Pentatricopeptide repeat-containing protein n=1 Tax=Ananas comosus var. bracteatus TaxID=296719 RepID=A0A6V7QDU2_ANACO|nr:unnamed protein product [Ananas comosus var. bracteatus]